MHRNVLLSTAVISVASKVGSNGTPPITDGILSIGIAQ